MPSPFLPERLRELRAEAGLSQAKLAEKISSDARQVSRYENGRLAPSLEAVVRIAETFNTSVDYLVTPRRPPAAPARPHNILGARLADLSQLTDDERATIPAVIDAITTAELDGDDRALVGFPSQRGEILLGAVISTV